MKTVKVVGLYLCIIYLLSPLPAYADFFGGDLPLLAEIVSNTLQQVTKLKEILGTGKDTLQYLRNLNRGVNDTLNLARTVSQKLDPGILSDLQGAEQALRAIEELYGRVPKTAEARMQRTMDRSAAEAIDLHNEAFRYAAAIDPQAERIKEHASVASPQGAEKLTAQSIGVLIQVMNQILRTNAALLKVQGEQLAIENRRSKMGSEQFKIQYEGLANAFRSVHSQLKLPRLGQSN